MTIEPFHSFQPFHNDPFGWYICGLIESNLYFAYHRGKVTEEEVTEEAHRLWGLVYFKRYLLNLSK